MKLQPTVSVADLASTADIADGSLVRINSNRLVGFAAKPAMGGRVFVYLNAEKERFEFSPSIQGLTALSYGADLTIRPDLESFDPALAIGHASKMEMIFMGGKFGLIVHLQQQHLMRFYDFQSGSLTPWAGMTVAEGFKKWQLGVERGRDEFIVLMQSGG